MGVWMSPNYCWLPHRRTMIEMDERLKDLIDGREAIGERPKQDPAAVIIASLKADDDCLLGYLAYDPVAIHWGFVKPQFRKLGVMTQLLNASGQNDGRTLRITHWSKLCEKLAVKRKLIYTPSLLHRPKHHTAAER